MKKTMERKLTHQDRRTSPATMAELDSLDHLDYYHLSEMGAI